MWAAADDDAALEIEQGEVGDLLRFADGLDAEAFLEDYEVQIALRALATRVGELKRARRGGRGRGMGGEELSIFYFRFSIGAWGKED